MYFWRMKAFEFYCFLIRLTFRLVAQKQAQRCSSSWCPLCWNLFFLDLTRYSVEFLECCLHLLLAILMSRCHLFHSIGFSSFSKEFYQKELDQPDQFLIAFWLLYLTFCCLCKRNSSQRATQVRTPDYHHHPHSSLVNQYGS